MTSQDTSATKVVIVGSGFGGSVAALRLVEKGYDVTIFEAGRRFADNELPETSWDVKNFVWAPALGWFGIQRIHQLPHSVVLAGAGVGGGSLNYANTLYVPPKPFFNDPQWADITDWESELSPFYDQASRMLGVVKNTCNGPAEQAMRETARAMNVEHTFTHTPVGVYFGDGPHKEVADPFFGGVGPARRTCTECGSCMTGCRVGAKNTLVKNYLALAERGGATVVPLREVTDIRPVNPNDGNPGYLVTTQRPGAKFSFAKAERTVYADHVIVAAGTWGTQSLLHRLKSVGSLPLLSSRLGELSRTNSEALLGSNLVNAPDSSGLTKGVAITTSFHPDDDTHIENCRYGKGSNAMGLMSTGLADGDGERIRLRGLLSVFREHKLDAFRAVSPSRWSERTIIALVMQSLDNSLTVSGQWRSVGLFRRFALTSTQGHGEPNPTWIPVGHKAVRILAEKLSEVFDGAKTLPGGTWGDIANIPMTAHFLGGCVIGRDAQHGVVDPYHRVFNYPGLHIVDGSTISANLGVNPSLTITAQAERALSMWPNEGDVDDRPALGSAYRRVAPVAPHRPVVPAGAVGELRLLPLVDVTAGREPTE